MSPVIVDHPMPHVARVMINRPQAKNAVDEKTRLALIEALQTVLADDDQRALLLCGAEGVFCAGGDLASMRGMSEDQARARMHSGHQIVDILWNARIPVVAAVERFAIGAGAGLALLSDYVVAGENALVSFPFLQFGLVPDWGSTQMLIRRVGWATTVRLILEKASVKGAQLADLGIADLVVEDSSVLPQALEKAAAFSLYPQEAFQRFKARMRAYPESFSSTLAAEADDQTACFLSEEFEEGLNAFQEKRRPDFIGSKHKSSR